VLLFRSAGQVFGVDADAAREILPVQPATRIPGAAAAIRGLVNVRGLLVTLVDAAVAIGLAATPSPEAGSVLLLDHGSHRVGLVVDEVLDLVVLDDADLDDRGALPGVHPDLVRAVATAAGRPFALLATSALLDPLLP
jgi:purine-binding chemotaxis protein CheW